MNSLFLKVGNQIINREHVCGVQYNTFSNQPEHTSKLIVFTVDGREIIFYDQDADLLWEIFDASAFTIRD